MAKQKLQEIIMRGGPRENGQTQFSHGDSKSQGQVKQPVILFLSGTDKIPNFFIEKNEIRISKKKAKAANVF